MNQLVTSLEGAKRIFPMKTSTPVAQVQTTNDYGRFSFLGGNRPVTKYHVQLLINSFEENLGLIALRPILVNEKFEIIDGQHRFQACQALELPVYYIVTPGLTIAVAQLMNALQKPWQIIDYAQSYAFSGNQHYKDFLKYREEYPLPLTVLMIYLYGGERNKLYPDFRLGKFEISTERGAIEDRLGKLSSLADLAPFWNTGPFAKAFFRLLKFEGYDHDRLLAGYAAIGPKRQASRIDYLRDFERAYNYGKPSSKTRFF